MDDVRGVYTRRATGKGDTLRSKSSKPSKYRGGVSVISRATKPGRLSFAMRDVLLLRTYQDAQQQWSTCTVLAAYSNNTYDVITEVGTTVWNVPAKDLRASNYDLPNAPRNAFMSNSGRECGVSGESPASDMPINPREGSPPMDEAKPPGRPTTDEETDSVLRAAICNKGYVWEDRPMMAKPCMRCGVAGLPGWQCGKHPPANGKAGGMHWLCRECVEDEASSRTPSEPNMRAQSPEPQAEWDTTWQIQSSASSRLFQPPKAPRGRTLPARASAVVQVLSPTAGGMRFSGARFSSVAFSLLEKREIVLGPLGASQCMCMWLLRAWVF